MSPTRSALLATLALVLLAGCGGREADLVLDIARGGHEGELELAVCGETPTSRCKRYTPFPVGSGGDPSVQVGIFVNDSTRRLDLQLLVKPQQTCAHFLVDFATDPEVSVRLDPSGSAPFTIEGCASCQLAVTPCDFLIRP